MRYEEGVLESIFGEEYLRYKARTSRWFPRPPGTDARRASTTGAKRGAARSATFLQYVVITVAVRGEAAGYGW